MYCIWTTFSGSGRDFKKHIQHILRLGLVTRIVKQNYVKSYTLIDKKVSGENVIMVGFLCTTLDQKLLTILDDLSFVKLYIQQDNAS